MPQVLVNVEATRDMKAAINDSVELGQVVRRCEQQLEGRGRVLLRPSGTEPLIRVMVEGNDLEEIQQIADTIARGYHHLSQISILGDLEDVYESGSGLEGF